LTIYNARTPLKQRLEEILVKKSGIVNHCKSKVFKVWRNAWKHIKPDVANPLKSTAFDAWLKLFESYQIWRSKPSSRALFKLMKYLLKAFFITLLKRLLDAFFDGFC